MSAAILMALLRVCQVASLVCVDQTNDPVRRTSLAQLPLAALFLLMLLHHIRRVSGPAIPIRRFFYG